MQDAEFHSVELNAESLYHGSGDPTNETLARLLSEAIIDTMTLYKADGWQLINMDFQGSKVTIHFTRPVKTKSK